MAKRKLQTVKQRVATSGHTEKYAKKRRGITEKEIER